MSHDPIDWDAVSHDHLGHASMDGSWTWSDAPQWSGEWPQAAADDRYMLGTQLAEGGMGSVYLAEDLLLRRQVALKVVRGAADSIAARQLLREARITAALRHSGIPDVLDAGTDAHGRPWFAMPVIPGRTLRSLLRATGVTPTQALHVLAHAAEILGFAHQHGIVHRDVKPDNIMVTPGGSAVVLDWGIARPQSTTEQWDALLTGARSAEDELLGTPGYMSPEQVLGASIGATTDVWALGICLVEVLEGAPPFGTVDGPATLRAIVQGAPPELEGPLGELVSRALSRDPKHRPADGTAFAAALRAAMTPTPPPPETPTPTERARSGWPWLVAGLAGGLAAAWALLPAPDAAPSRSLVTPALAHIARRSALEHDTARAQLAAIAGLRAPSPHDALFRGVLAGRSTAVEWSSRTPVPPCERRVLAPDASAMVCIHADDMEVYDLPDMQRRWQRPIRLDAVMWVGDRLLGSVAGSYRLGLIDAQTGGALPEVEGRTLLDRVHPSSHPDRILMKGTDDTALGILNPVEGGVRPLVGGTSGCAGVVRGDRSVVAACIDGLWLWDADDQPISHHPRSALRTEADHPFVAVTSADDQWMAEGSLAGVVRVYALDPPEERAATQLAGGMVRSLAVSPDGRWVAAVDEQGQASVWPRERDNARLQLPGRVDAVAFDGPSTLRTLGDHLETWTLPADPLPGVLDAESGVSGLDWSGDWIAASLGNGSVRRWNTTTGTRDHTQVQAVHVLKDVALARSGAAAVLGLTTEPGAQWIWDDAPAVDFPAPAGRRVVWNEGRGLVMLPTRAGPLAVDAEGTPWPTLNRPSVANVDLEPTADGAGAVVLDETGEVLILAWTDPPTLSTWARAGGGHAVALAHLDDTLVAVGHRDGVSLWARDATEAEAFLATPTIVVDVAVSPDGGQVAAGLLDGEVWVWDRATRARIGVLLGHRERASGLRFSEDGQTLLTGSWDETLRLWDLSVLTAPVGALEAAVTRRWGRSPEELFSAPAADLR